MKKNDKQRLFEVMGRLDKTFKPTLNEGFEDIETTDDITIPTDAGEETPVEEKSVEEKYEELKTKVDELYGMVHGEETGEEIPVDDVPAEELPAEPEAGEMGIETGEVNLQEVDDENKEKVVEDVNITVTEKKGKALSSEKAPEVKIGK